MLRQVDLAARVIRLEGSIWPAEPIRLDGLLGCRSDTSRRVDFATGADTYRLMDLTVGTDTS